MQSQNIPNYLPQAVLTTIFCCLPFGVVAIVYAVQVNSKLEAGDYAGATSASNAAKMWCWLSFGSTIAIFIIYLIIALVAR